MASKLFLSATLPLLLSTLIIALNLYSRSSISANGDSEQFEFVPIVGALGPESYAFDGAGGGPYTGVSDGRIIKWEENQRLWIDFAVTSSNRSHCEGPHDHQQTEHICGRPLGLKFHKTSGDLYIADAYMGLLKVGPEGGLATRVVNQAQGVPFALTNGVDIDENSGIVYFTDSSTRFQRRNYLSVVLTGDKTGRLLRYDPRSNELDVLLENLAFPNGVVLSENGDFLLIAETTKSRILKYWLQTTKAGMSEVFARDLPGFPDNIKRSPRGGFWVGIHSKKRKVFGWILSNPRLAKTVVKLPFDIMKLYTKLAKGKAKGLMMRLSEEGSVLDVLEDSSGVKWDSVSEAEERDGYIWIGSIHKPYAGKFKLKNDTDYMNL